MAHNSVHQIDKYSYAWYVENENKKVRDKQKKCEHKDEWLEVICYCCGAHTKRTRYKRERYGSGRI